KQRVGDGRLVIGDEDQRCGRHRPSIVAPPGGGYAARMNYRHAFHAGNHADVLKHIVLLSLLDALLRKDSPFFVLDTHAGRGRYLQAVAANNPVDTLLAYPGSPLL